MNTNPFLPLRLLPPAVLLVAACVAFALGFAPPTLAAPIDGSGVAVTETRTAGDFDAVAVAGPIDLTLRQAGAPAVAVTADDNLLPLVETVVETGREGRTLKIRLRRAASLRPQTAIKVVVDAVQLRSIAAAGDAVLRGLNVGALSLELAGSCELQAEGRAERLRLAIAGSGEADLAGLAADDVSVRIAGSGDARVVADRSLQVSIAGSGDVSYAGRAVDVTSAIVGSGALRRR